MIILCGRYTVFTEAEIIEMNAIINEISRKFGDGAVNTGEIFPTNTTPVLIMEDNRLAPTPVSWGFPKRDGKGAVINARSETALQKAMFSKPLLTRRCVIPSTGFYEWALAKAGGPGQEQGQLSMFADPEQLKPAKSKKVKLHFRLPGEHMLYMAGMIGTFTDAAGNRRDAFCILTTAAAHTISRFYERMPVIIRPGECEDWINSDAFMREVLAREGPDLEWTVAG